MLALATAFALLVSTACGTILYPERHGQRSGRVDPAVLIFDGAFLLLFVIPGLVALGVDFHTGAIYLPRGGGKVARWHVPPEELTPERLEAIALAHTGERIPLDDPRWQLASAR